MWLTNTGGFPSLPAAISSSGLWWVITMRGMRSFWQVVTMYSSVWSFSCVPACRPKSSSTKRSSSNRASSRRLRISPLRLLRQLNNPSRLVM